MTRLHIWTFLILYITTLVGALYDLSQKHPPQGNLGVQLDYSLALNSGSGQPTQQVTQVADVRQVVYTCWLKFNNDVGVIGDGQLLQMAIDAYNEIAPERMQYNFNPRQGQPTVMNILAVGKYIFLASSQKGQTSYTLSVPESRVYKSLKLCQIVFASERDFPTNYACTAVNSDGTCVHSNGYNCGEIMAAHSWYRLNPDAISMLALKGRILAVEGLKNGGVAPKAPCGTGKQDSWGCNLFVVEEGLTVVTETTPQPYVLADLAGGLVSKGQEQLCS